MAAEEALILLGTLARDRARLTVRGFSPELDESGRMLRSLRSQDARPDHDPSGAAWNRSSRLVERAPRQRHRAL
jgi:hypothetical protein